MTLPNESVTDSVTDERDTLARARPPTEGVSRLSRVTENRSDRDVERDSDIATAGGLRNVTVTSEAEARRQEDKKRFAKDPRFGLLAAGQQC